MKHSLATLLYMIMTVCIFLNMIFFFVSLKTGNYLCVVIFLIGIVFSPVLLYYGTKNLAKSKLTYYVFPLSENFEDDSFTRERIENYHFPFDIGIDTSYHPEDIPGNDETHDEEAELEEALDEYFQEDH